MLHAFDTSRKYIAFIARYKQYILPLFVIGFLSSLFRVALPYLSKYLIDASFLKKDMSVFIKVSAVSVILFFTSLIFRGIEGIVRNRMQVQIKYRISRVFLRKIFMLDMFFFQCFSTGENIYRITDTERVSIFLSEQVPRALVDGVLFLCMLGLSFFISPLLTLPLIFLLPLAVYRYVFVYGKRWEIFKEIWKTQARLYKIMEEILFRIFIIKAFRNEFLVRQKYMKSLLVSLRLKAKNARFLLMTSLGSDLFFQGFLGGISVLGGWMIIKGRLSLGQYTAFLLYAGQLVFLAGSLSSFLSQIMQDVFSTNKFLEIMQMQPTIKEIPLAHQIGRFNKGIEFNRVTFGYQPDKHILENLSFKMPAGHWYALVGPSGCGKTTIVSLLLRLYDLGGGEIVIDDYRLSEVALNSLGKNIAIAPAEPFLFDGSLKDNITCAVKSLSKQTIEEAARAAQIHDFIINLPLSYDTVIGENAFQLSEGQKQKIAIARALVRQPKILILDEAMASLDSESESRIIEGIRKLNIPLVIIISHRLSTVMACEYARYIKTKNTIVSSTPSALLENDRDFRALFNPQINKHA